MPKTTSIWSIFKGFFIVGATAYGGPAMMPAMRREVVDKRAFVSPGEFKLGLGLCQTIPGGTLMQLAAYIGLQLRGLKGAIAAYLGFSAPAFLLMVLLSTVYADTRDAPWAHAIYTGLKVVVLGICLMSCLDFVKRFAPTRRHQAFTAGAAALFLFGAGIVPIVGAAAILGLVFLDGGAAPEKMEGQGKTGALGLAVGVGLVMLAGLSLLFVFDRELFDLSVSMIKVDMLAFGGFGIYPVMYAEVVNHRHWINESTFAEGMALAQVTPGPNMLAAAFMGYVLRGVVGAVTASVSIFSGSFVVALAAAHYRDRITGSRHARKALAGVLATLGGMIVAVCYSLAQVAPWGWRAGLVLALTLAAMAKKIQVYWIVPAAAGLSLFLY